MSFSGPGFMDGPASMDDEMEIPGFPKNPTKSEGLAASLQEHLEKLSANAKSIHHVLEALCGGLDRLERKIDTNYIQIEARMENIVHHMTGEADEDTMSEWSSLRSSGSPSDLGSSVARSRNPFGGQMSPLNEVQLVHPDANVDEGGSHEDRFVGLTVEDVQPSHMVVPQGIMRGRKEGFEPDADDHVGSIPAGGNKAVPPEVAAMPDGQDEPTPCTEYSSATANEGAARGENFDAKTTITDPQSLEKAGEEPQQDHIGSRTHRRSNQDDESEGSTGKLTRARKGVLISEPKTPDTDRQDSNHILDANRDDESKEFELQGSISSGGSDVKYVARQRWIWAFGRVCQLIRRRKRKSFEIMSQRATDRSVRMGSRVAILEQQMDETKDSLAKVDWLKKKYVAHTDGLGSLHEKVAELSGLFGVEERTEKLVKAMQAQVEGILRSTENDISVKLRSGQDELEARLEEQMKRNGSRLEDMDDRTAIGENVLRRAEETIAEMQEEAKITSRGIFELERKVRMDEDRLDNLETLKKAHQRRLSELRVQVEGAPVGGGSLLEPEPEETETGRMARLIDAAGAVMGFLAIDLEKIVDKAATTAKNTNSADEGGGDLDFNNVSDTTKRLRNISVEAAEYSRRCKSSWKADSEKHSDQEAAERAEILCAMIDDALSDHVDGSVNLLHHNQQASQADTGLLSKASPLEGIFCQNGRQDLPQRLLAARDALLPIVGEGTSVGGLKVAVLGLKASLNANIEQATTANAVESRLRDLLQSRVSELDNSVDDMKVTLYDRELGFGDDGEKGAGGEVNQEELEQRLMLKADVFWVQRELQRLWEALDSGTLSAVASSNKPGSGQLVDSQPRPRSAPLRESRKDDPETVGEEYEALSLSSGGVVRVPMPSSTKAAAGIVGDPVSQVDHGRRSSFNEGSSLIKDLLRKTSRLEEQIAAKANNKEVMRALSSVGTKLRKTSSALSLFEDSLANKIEKKDLHKLASLISNGVNGDAPSGGRGGTESDPNSVVIASRLNSKFRCLSCDRPLPTLGPPGPPKLGTVGLSIAGAGAPRSPQRIGRLRLTGVGEKDVSLTRPNSPVTSSTSPAEAGDVTGWGRPSSMGDSLPGSSDEGSKDAGRRWRKMGGGASSTSSADVADQPGRLEPIAANTPGEQIAGIMSRYPRMMPPPSRIRTAAGGGFASLGPRPGSSLGTGRV